MDDVIKWLLAGHWISNVTRDGSDHLHIDLELAAGLPDLVNVFAKLAESWESGRNPSSDVHVFMVVPAKFTADLCTTTAPLNGGEGDLDNEPPSIYVAGSDAFSFVGNGEQYTKQLVEDWIPPGVWVAWISFRDAQATKDDWEFTNYYVFGTAGSS